VSPVTWIVIGFVTLLCVLGIAATIALVGQRVKRLGETVKDLQDTVGPELTRLQGHAEVARQELERVADSHADLRDRDDDV
jgi:hypothetical protein